MDEAERWKAKLDQLIAGEELGEILGMVKTYATGNNPAHWGDLAAAAETIREAKAKVHRDKVTAIAREANRLSEKANELSEKAIRESREANWLSEKANQGSKWAHWIAGGALFIAVLALGAQIYPLVFKPSAAVSHPATSP